MTAPAHSPAAAPFEDSRLIATYTFEEFVVGPHNRFPHAAAQAVAENLGKAYNPLFIYGPVGMGKTHLMQAVGHRVLHNNKRAKVLYVTAEQFMMEVIELLQEGNLQTMRERYRQLDLLLVDDIQFLASSESTQEEFFHTFNELHHGGKQIIMTSDRPPKMLTTLEDRLRSRFEWGLIADIKQTNLETRVAILRKKESHLSGMKLGDDIRLYIASRLKSNIRELEGFLRRVQAYAQLNNQPVSLPLVREIMRELLPPQEWEEGEEAANADLAAAAANEVALPPPHVGPLAPLPAPAAAGWEAPAAPPPQPEPPAYPPGAPFEGGERSLTESLLELGSSLGLGPGTGAPPPPPPPAAQGWPPAHETAAPEPPPAYSPPSGGITLEPMGEFNPPPDLAPAPPPVLGEALSAPPIAPGSGALEEMPEAVAPTAPNAISAAFFFPKGRIPELEMMKRKFQDIIKKHKLKFELHAGLEAGYPPDQTVSFTSFLESSQKRQLSIAIVLGPPPDGRLQETIFHQRLQDTFDPHDISLQFLPWDELTKDYRYLNISLDITLIRFNKQRGKR